MAKFIFILLIAVPIIEVALFIKIGGFIGFWPTLGIIILTAAVGAELLRRQGLAALRRVEEEIDRNRLPVGAVFDGLCLLVAGALLLTPGFFTDVVGFLLFVPPLRAWLGRRLAEYLIAHGRVEAAVYSSTTAAADGAASGPGPVIDGEFRDITPDKGPPDDAAGSLAPPENRGDGNGRDRGRP